MTNPGTFEQALAAAMAWMGRVPGVVAVGEGEEAGERTIDVWFAGLPEGQLPAGLALDLAPHRVRFRSGGGPICALDKAEDTGESEDAGTT